MNETIIKEIIEIGKRCGEKNFTPGTSGNISARTEKGLIITASGSANGYLENDDFVEIDFNANILEGNKKPSSEKMLHIKFYEMRKDINYIIHVHSPYLSTFASCQKSLDMPLMAEIVYYFGQIPLAEYGLPSSDELVKNTSKYFDKYNSILMANHGFITGGRNLKEAYLNLELAESYAQVVINSNILSGAKRLNKKQVQEIIGLRGK